jgi:hypothetical protein
MHTNDGQREETVEGPWNPGIHSELTRELLALSSIFRRENIFGDLRQALEIRDVTGLKLEQLAIFRPERLALHELLVRVTADYEVPDPEDASIDSLGINLRRMTEALASRVIEPLRSDLVGVYHQLRDEIEAIVRSEISSTLGNRPAIISEGSGQASDGSRSWFRRSSDAGKSPARESEWERDENVLGAWSSRTQVTESPVHAAALRALVRTASSIRSQHGKILGEHTFLASVATELACNDFGSEVIGQYLEPRINDAADREGFRRLPVQPHSVAMVIRGASASGKSTMRPLQRQLAGRMGLYWGDFALISPDTWRKALLDFNSLGPLYKYAGMLTSQEVGIIDRKLDAYLVRKGERRCSSHLLIDRFRFDSFALDSDESKHLPFRFREMSYYFFMVTPPEVTVERAWRRGLQVGRYKAVDDLLAHNVEAFTGMQSMLFARTLDPNRRIHYELLDNDVPPGDAPLTIAFGWSGEMNVLDLKCMLDIERYRKINVNAKRPAEVYPDQLTMTVRNNMRFLSRCIESYPRVNFADRATGRIYARYIAGRLEWLDRDALTRVIANIEVRAILHAAAPDLFGKSVPHCRTGPEFLQHDRYHTIGRWGSEADQGII